MMNAATPARTAGCANVSSHEGPPRHLLLGILILIATEKDCRVRLLAAAHSVRRAGTLNSYLCDAASDKPVPVAELVDTLSDGTKVKRRIPRMRACNEKDAKGKLCAGHLKRWYFFGDEVKQKFGADAEIYRCEHCKTLYLPSLEEEPRTGTLSY